MRAAVQRRHAFLALNLVLGMGGLVWVLAQFGRGALSLLAANPSPGLLLAFVAAVLAALAIAALRWSILLDGLGAAPGFGRLCAFRAASQSLSAVLPGGRLGGEPLRAWYAVQTGVTAPVAITTVAIDRALEMTTSLAFVVAVALVLAERDVPGAARALPVPGAVGTVEAAGLWVFGLLGHAPEVGVAVGLAVRLRDLVWAAPGFVYLLVRALRPPVGDAAVPVVTPENA